ncbi:MAG: helix-hairpin-helix domain-containing protein [Sarcina sp.]
MTKKERIIGCVVGLVLLISVGVFINSFREAQVISEKEVLSMFKEGESENKEVENNKNDIESNTNQEQTNQKKTIVVEVKGEVKNPNVYTLNEGSRVNELIEKAGGLTQEADIDNINRASIVSDGQCIIVGNINNTDEEKIDMTSMQGSATTQGNGSSANDSGSVNLNTASLEELQTLTGIGAAKANAIIEYRETSGGFKTIEDIKNISGIGEKTFEKIRDRLSV